MQGSTGPLLQAHIGDRQPREMRCSFIAGACLCSTATIKGINVSQFPYTDKRDGFYGSLYFQKKCVESLKLLSQLCVDKQNESGALPWHAVHKTVK
jgi:hypothetical protein